MIPDKDRTITDQPSLTGESDGSHEKITTIKKAPDSRTEKDKTSERESNENGEEAVAKESTLHLVNGIKPLHSLL